MFKIQSVKSTYLLFLLVVSTLASSCGTFNIKALEIRKRTRMNREALVIDMRALKTIPEKRKEFAKRENVESGNHKVDVIKRDPPSRGYNYNY